MDGEEEEEEMGMDETCRGKQIKKVREEEEEKAKGKKVSGMDRMRGKGAWAMANDDIQQ
jgi:hypothetical protein